MTGGYRAMTQLLAVATIALGVAMVATAIARGGGVLSLGVVLGLLFVAVGAGRLYLLRPK
jgi:hypothetical protein